jgi:hypothetical protein
VRWREFFAGVWARLSGSATGGPWPRISELDQKARMPAGDKEDESEDSDGDSSSLVGESAISNLPFRPVNPSTLPQIDATLEKVADESEHGKLKQPADVLTPPYTPATQSPTGASAPVRPESPSSEIELPGSVLAEEEKHEAGFGWTARQGGQPPVADPREGAVLPRRLGGKHFQLRLWLVRDRVFSGVRFHYKS